MFGVLYVYDSFIKWKNPESEAVAAAAEPDIELEGSVDTESDEAKKTDEGEDSNEEIEE